MKEIEYKTLEAEVINIISSNGIMVLATSSKDRVTARAMSCVNDGLKIYFQTGIDSIKYAQMKENPNVALCCANMQIEGKSKFLDQSLREKTIIGKYAIEHPGSYEKYSSMKKSFVVEIVPSLVTLWKYENGNPLRDILDIAGRKAYREYYDISERVD